MSNRITVTDTDIFVSRTAVKLGYQGAVTADLVTILGRYDAARIGDASNARYFELCWKCQGTGFLSYYAGVHGGVCFPCTGNGLSARVGAGSALDVVKAVRRREQARDRREAKRKAQHDADRLALQQWRDANPAVTQIADMVITATDTDPRAYSGTLRDLAMRAGHSILTDKQITFMTELVEREQAEHAERQANAAQRRWLGTEGQKITFTATVTYSTHVTNNYNGVERTSTLYLLTDDDGNTVKWFRSGYHTPERGEQYTITATINKLGESDEHGKFTQITRGKVHETSP